MASAPRPWSDYGISSTLEVRESEQYGRGVYAVTAIPPGVEVMEAKPLVHVLSNDVRGQHCDFCLKVSQSLLKCSRCKFVRYCGKECQRGDWRWHGGECNGISRVPSPHTPTPLVRLVVRCLHTLTETRAQLDILCSHGDKLSSEVKEELASLMFGVQRLSDTSASAVMKEAYHILCKALCNTFTIHRADLDAIGAGLYGGCLPNCIAVFRGTTLFIRTIEPIRPGEQLFISYLDLLDAHQQRQRSLQKTYSFQCHCNRCLTEFNTDSPFHMFYTTAEGSSDDEVSVATKIGTDSLKLVGALRKKGDWDGMMRECELYMSRQAPLLHQMHHITVRCLQELVYACIEAQNWSRAISASEELTKSLERYLPKYHPVLAIHLLRLGKLYRLSGTTEHLKISVTNFTQAVQQLRVAYGLDHTCTRETLELLHDSQRELSH